jgi:hypothetical protein
MGIVDKQTKSTAALGKLSKAPLRPDNINGTHHGLRVSTIPVLTTQDI